MKRLFLASLVSATLIGCGGSDGGDKKPTTPEQPDTSIPTTPLEPSTPVEPEEDKDEPLTPLEPSTPVDPEEDGEDMTDVVPSTPITIETIAELLDEPVDKLEMLFAEGENFKFYLKDENNVIIHFAPWNDTTWVAFDVMNSTATHYLSFQLEDTQEFVEDSGHLTRMGYEEPFDYKFNTLKVEGLNIELHATIPYTTETADSYTGWIDFNYQYKDTLSEEVYNSSETIMGFWYADDSRAEYMVKILEKFADAPLTELDPSIPPSEEQQFADVTGYSVEEIEALVEGTNNLSVYVDENKMPHINVTQPHQGFDAYVYQFDLMNGVVNVSAREIWEHDSSDNYFGMGFSTITLNGVEMDYSILGYVGYSVEYNTWLTTRTELMLTKEVVENLFVGEYRLDYMLTPYNQLPYLVTGSISTDMLSLIGEEKSMKLKEIVTNYMTK